MEEPPPPPETKLMSMKYLDPDREKNEFYRTKPCKFFFERGICLKGDLCNYSHDPELYEEFLKEQEYFSDSYGEDDSEYDSEYSSDDDDDGNEKSSDTKSINDKKGGDDDNEDC